MDANTVRQQLREVNEQLARIEAERTVLLSLVAGYEGWLKLQGLDGLAESDARPMPLPLTVKKGKTARKGTISLRKAMLKVLQDAQGHPLHAKEIAARATALGAITESKDPPHIIDLMGYTLRDRGGEPLERVGTMTWRYLSAPSERHPKLMQPMPSGVAIR